MEASNSLVEIVERFRSWIPRRLEAPASTMSRDFWMPDRSCFYCFECESPFTMFNRRHHCRICGRVFCGKCSFNTITASVDGFEGVQYEEGERVRVCNFCYRKAEQASTANGMAPTLTPSPSGRSLASRAIGVGAPVIPTIASEQVDSVGSSHREPVMDPPQSASPERKHRTGIHQAASRVHSSISPRSRDQPTSPYAFRNNRRDDAYDYQKEHDEVEQNLVGTEHRQDDPEGYTRAELDQDQGSEPRDNDRKSSSRLYSPQNSMEHNSTVSEDGSERLSRMESMSDGKGSSCEGSEESLDELSGWILSEVTNIVDFETKDEAWYPPPANPDVDDECMADDDDDEDGMADEDDEDDEGLGQTRSPGSASSLGFRRELTASEEHRRAIRAQVDGHFRNLVAQLLYQQYVDYGERGDPESWLEIVSALSWQAAAYVKPDTNKGGAMDPGGYVKVKCIASGKPSDSVFVKGIVCRKNVAHKRMTSRFKNAKVLLLGGALEYQRVSNQLSSLDTLLQQEREHLSMTVAKIQAHHPNVLLVEKTVSRFAQDTLLDKEITLVLNVKKSVQERIARCTDAQVAGSPDSVGQVKLGHCDHFHVEKFVEEHGSAGQGGRQLTKFLMFFEGCRKPLGCTVLLRGANGDELKKVKHAIQLTIFAAYHLALETSFLADEGATVPEYSSKSPMSVPRPSRQPSLDRSTSSVLGFSIPAPERSQILDSHSQQGGERTGQSMNLSISPRPIRSSSIGLPITYNQYEYGTSIIPAVVPFSGWSSCVSSATNSPGTSPAQTASGFQSSIARSATSGGISSSATYHNINNGMYPGGQSWHASGLSASLKEQPDAMDSGTFVYNAKSSKVSGLPTNPGLDLSVTTSASMNEKLISSEVGGEASQSNSEGVTSPLRTGIQESWHSDVQQIKEDFPPHQDQQIKSILVQLSTRCLKKRSVCQQPQFLRIQFYGSTDKPLGSFLRDTVFDTNNPCSHCEEPGDEHVYCFTHHQSSLTISVKRMKDDYVLPGDRDGKIWMWHRCLRCPLVNGVPPPTPRVVMSNAAWGLSFGKFLELSFSNYESVSRVAACGHSLHRHFLRFYGLGCLVARFRYAEIKLKSVYLPPLQLEFNGSQQKKWLKKEVEEVTAKVELFFVEVLNRLGVLGKSFASSKVSHSSTALEAKRRYFVALEILLQKDKAEIEELLQKAAPATPSAGQPPADIFLLNSLRRELLTSEALWAARLQKLASTFPPRMRTTGSIDESLLSRELITPKRFETQEGERDSSIGDGSSHLQRLRSDSHSNSRKKLGSDQPEPASLEEDLIEKQTSTEAPADVVRDLSKNPDPLKPEELADANGLDFRLDNEKQSSVKGELTPGGNPVQNFKSMVGNSSFILKETSTLVAADVENKQVSGSSFNHEQERHDSTLTRVVPSRILLDADLTGRRALSEGSFPLSTDLSGSFDYWARDKFSDDEQKRGEVSNGVHTECIQNAERSVQEPCTVQHAMSEENIAKPEPSSASQEKFVSNDGQPSPTSPMKSVENREEFLEEWGGGTPNLMKSFSRSSSGLSSNSHNARDGRWGGLRAAQLMADGDPRLLLPPGYDDMLVAVYDDEATSLIAYAISSREHYAHVRDGLIEREKDKEREQKKESLEHLSTESVIFHPLQSSSNVSPESDRPANFSRTSSFDQPPSRVEAEIEQSLTSTPSQMVKKTIDFSDDTPQGKVKFSVTCYFAKQFDALRKKCCMGNTEYIRSLSRCKKWGATGGKSNVFFAKTADDRFVVKQVTRTELNSFLDFAPDYFKYLCEGLNGNPTCLAKILGVYEVKVTKGGKETKMDLIVMENLLFGRKITHLYDLKGSVRSRYNRDTNGKNQVLLDMNLVENLPIFVGSKAKRVLERAVWNDTHFLSQVFVMDYSLLVGVDEENKELVVGIIDFMRQYTWDKHLEHWVKASGILGGPKNAAPTVISPKQYKKRFRKAMTTYFITVPDQWTPPPSPVPSVGEINQETFNIAPLKEEETGEDCVSSRAQL